MQFMVIIWQDYILFRRRFWSITAGAMIGPILYLIVFGWGLGSEITIAGSSYIHFVIPGIIALTTMNLSFSNVASEINISRVYSKSFEEIMIAPLSIFTYATAKITAGALRGLYSALIIILLSIVFQASLNFGGYFILIVILNCYVFSAMGFMVGMMIESHADISKFSNFIITPMSFLCGTFFPLEKMPFEIKELIWLLPLSQTSIALRQQGEHFLNIFLHPVILMFYFAFFLILGMRICAKAE